MNEFLVDGRLVYQLETAGHRRGKEVFQNRLSINVDYSRKDYNHNDPVTADDAEALAEIIAELLNQYFKLGKYSKGESL